MVLLSFLRVPGLSEGRSEARAPKEALAPRARHIAVESIVAGMTAVGHRHWIRRLSLVRSAKGHSATLERQSGMSALEESPDIRHSGLVARVGAASPPGRNTATVACPRCAWDRRGVGPIGRWGKYIRPTCFPACSPHISALEV